MRIAVYGGSFDPPHRGHVEAARVAAETLGADRFLIVPDREAPHKELSGDGPSPEERLALCRLAFAGIPGAEISDVELRREGKSYTADTAEQLLAENPGAELTLVLGEDMLRCFEDWYRYRYLLSNCELAVLPRPEEDGDELRALRGRFERQYGARIRILTFEPVEASSREIRGRLPRRLGADELPEAVYAEIIRRRWYGAQPELSWLREKVYEGYLKESRIAHVAGCEAEAVKLALRWGEDAELAAEAAILHDITKKLKPQEQLNLCEKYAIIINHAMLNAPEVIHAVTGAAMARELFGVNDEVYGAIRWHTTGRPDMTNLEKIVYLADAVEPTRSYPSVERLRSLAEEDLDAALLETMERTLERIRGLGGEPCPDTVEAAAWYAQRKNQ